MKWSMLIWFCLAVLVTPPYKASAGDSESTLLLLGHDVADLRRAAAERRNHPRAKDSTDPVLLEFTVSPAPEVIIAYTADGTFDRDWFLYDPGTVSTMEIPQGTYEILAAWWDLDRMVRRISIRENVVVSDTNHSINIDDSIVEHVLRLNPIGPDGLPVLQGIVTSNRVLLREGCGLPVFQSFEAGFLVNASFDTTVVGEFSTLSKNYSFEYFAVDWDANLPAALPAYSYSASYRGGITDDVTVETDPAEWREITFHHHPDPGTASLIQKASIPNHPFADLPNDQLGVSGLVNCFGEAGRGLGIPFEQTLFAYPRDDPESTVGFLRLRIFEAVDSCLEIWGVRPMYQPPYIALDTGPKGYLLGSSVPVYEPAGDTFHTGLGPAYWFGKIDDRGDEIGISSSHGILLIPFLDQTGSRPGYSGPLIPYELYHGDTLVKSGLLPFNDEDDETVLTLDGPGGHTLVLSYDDYWMGQTQGLTTVTATFGVGADDKNPPYFMRLAVRAAGTEVAHLRIPGGTVEFLAADDSSGIANLSAWLDTDMGRQDLVVDPLVDGGYRIDIETCGFINPSGTLSILIEDAAGNKLETGMMMPLRRAAMDDESIEVD